MLPQEVHARLMCARPPSRIRIRFKVRHGSDLDLRSQPGGENWWCGNEIDWSGKSWLTWHDTRCVRMDQFEFNTNPSMSKDWGFSNRCSLALSIDSSLVSLKFYQYHDNHYHHNCRCCPNLFLKLKLGPRSFLRGGDPRRTLCQRSSSVLNSATWGSCWDDKEEEGAVVDERQAVGADEHCLGEKEERRGGVGDCDWYGTLTLRSESWVFRSF